MEQIRLAYTLPKETVTAIMMRNRNTKVKVCSSKGNTDFFDIVVSVLQVDTLAPYLRMLIDMIKENGFTLKKARNKRYPTETITNADYADDIALLANTPSQAESLLYSLELAAGDIELYVCERKQNGVHVF